MSGVFNTVWVGYQFEQDFIILQDSLPSGAGIRASIPYRRTNNSKGRIAVSFTLLAPDTWRLVLTPAQTRDMSPGTIQVDPVITGAGIEERPLGVRISIPVSQSMTERA